MGGIVAAWCSDLAVAGDGCKLVLMVVKSFSKKRKKRS